MFGLGINPSQHVKDFSFSLYPHDKISNKWLKWQFADTDARIFFSEESDSIHEFSGFRINDLECWELMVSSANKTSSVDVFVETMAKEKNSVPMFGTVICMNENDPILKPNTKSKNFFYL